MRDVLDVILRWYSAGETFALATVVSTFRSAPREPGAAMAVSAGGEVVGSVSGGCVEGAVYEAARQVMESGRPVLERYGVSDDEAFAVGLTCGGILHVYVEPVNRETFPELAAVAAAVAGRRPVAVATTVTAPGTGPASPARPATGGAASGEAAAVLGARRVIWPGHASGSLGAEGLDVAVDDDARGMLAQGLTGERHYGRRGERRMDEVAVFVRSFAPPPRMLVFGAIDFAAAVARIGKFLGYHITVCDARGVFATRKRFPDADEVVVRWPHQYLRETEVDGRTAICVLTHDPKFDVPLLEVALRTPAGYIGAMGSRRTHDDRMKRLREAGLAEEELDRLHSPIGLDIGARTPEETAVSIAAELIRHRWGGTGMPLKQTEGRIHGTPPT
ncbi:XdhC family protein [Planomonospora sp. ID67723]|uniref:XdhC family protein n=1 Tax=Planomonospora sp. ID67723 TaxID=2738134 RepID=UPI0018C3EEAD|nr:XdhC/CoxI family protein [Planomonospora sp. ID67723]MBG0830680.1 XdhC family protein [Planomonospora sp. ID67723]